MHELTPDRRRARGTRGVRHRGVVRVADPDAHHEVGGVAERPVVEDQFRRVAARGPAGARLCGGREGEIQQGVASEHPRARFVVRKDRGDEEGVFGADDLLARGRFVFVNDVAFKIGDFQDRDGRDFLALVREHRVGGRHLDQADLTPAERQRETVIGRGQRGDAQPFGHRNHPVFLRRGRIVVNADEVQGFDGGDVK